ncbi:MAG: beta-lactamase family protein [Chloroflexota bacterium]|nr:beta-lactamase family protein [Chloroflexota bacterium]
MTETESRTPPGPEREIPAATENAGGDCAVMATAMTAVWDVITGGTAAGAYAGAVASVSVGGQIILHRADGYAELEPGRVPMTVETVFDLASLTKVVATLPVVLRLVEAGAFGLDDPVPAILPAPWTTAHAGITVRHLLTHTAGLADWRPLYLDAHGPDAVRDLIARTDPVAAPGERVLYSDLGFILLGEIVRHHTGLSIDRATLDHVFAPLGMAGTRYSPDPAAPRDRDRIAATERGNPREVSMIGERAAEFAGWRQDIIRGQVHDGNAHHALDGVAGHAGLFAPAADLLRYGQCWLAGGALDGYRLLSPETIAEATRPQAPGRGLGWRTGPAESPDDPFFTLAPDAYGHTGFTGTAIWVAPEMGAVAVLLTNRVHPISRDEIAAVRPAFAAALRAALDGGAD